MVKKTREPMFGIPKPPADNRRSAPRRGGLGPRGRGIFQRLLGSFGNAAPIATARREACSIAIASGKGGTGKSFLATSLAVLMHQKQRAVTLVDCDFGLACCHLLLGANPRASIQQVLTGASSIRDVRIATPAGPHLVPGGSGVRKMADLADPELLALAHSLGELAATEQTMILDAGAGIAAQNLLTLLCADHIVLVTQPEIAALTDAYAVVKCTRKLRPTARFWVVVNRAQTTGQGDSAFERLAEVARRHTGAELRFLGEIAEDPTVSQRRLGQQPLVLTDPEGKTALAIAAIAERLEQEAGPLTQREVAADQGIEARYTEHRLFL